MTKVIFKFDKEKDLWNYWDKSNKRSLFWGFSVNSKIKKICEDKKFDKCKKELQDYLSNLQTSELINIHLKYVEVAWRKIEKEFFDRMNNLIKHNFNRDIFAYLTTLGICPYDPDEPSFMFSLFYSLPKSLQTCGHEIMHLYFHKFYWKDVEKKIGEEKTGDLKEALTVLLNLEFRDLWFAEDMGYGSHQKLREFIIKNWGEEKDFEKLLEKCIEYLK